jgi:hypothetical protein
VLFGWTWKGTSSSQWRRLVSMYSFMQPLLPTRSARITPGEGHMTVQLARRLFTVNEFYRMAEAGIFQEDDRLELINGEIVEMVPTR